MTIYLHIGYPKTATSWFQFRFFPFVENFKFVDREDIISKLINPYALEFDAKSTRNFFLDKYGDHLILSLEGFIGTTHNFGLNGYLTKEHAQRLQVVFPEARILLFIRRQQDIIASSYLQYVTGGGTYSVNRYLKSQLDQGLRKLTTFSFKYFEYDSCIRLYQRFFNPGRIYIYLFEDFVQDIQGFISKFIVTHQFKIQLNNIDFSPEKERIRRGIVQLSFFANLFTREKMFNKYYLVHIPKWFWFYKSFIKKINDLRIFGNKPTTIKILGKRNYQFIEEYYKDSNQRLVHEFGMEQIKKYNYPI